MLALMVVGINGDVVDSSLQTRRHARCYLVSAPHQHFESQK